uniref:Uncharacterized protein n=1 Tax=Vespula pensylvanica TaxID=30213 RepID=A0A834U4T4_VESPE|nr:hypothetical protein H0235_011068 [Vespula pensylvanica]
MRPLHAEEGGQPPSEWATLWQTILFVFTSTFEGKSNNHRPVGPLLFISHPPPPFCRDVELFSAIATGSCQKVERERPSEKRYYGFLARLRRRRGDIVSVWEPLSADVTNIEEVGAGSIGGAGAVGAVGGGGADRRRHEEERTEEALRLAAEDKDGSVLRREHSRGRTPPSARASARASDRLPASYTCGTSSHYGFPRLIEEEKEEVEDEGEEEEEDERGRRKGTTDAFSERNVFHILSEKRWRPRLGSSSELASAIVEGAGFGGEVLLSYEKEEKSGRKLKEKREGTVRKVRRHDEIGQQTQQSLFTLRDAIRDDSVGRESPLWDFTDPSSSSSSSPSSSPSSSSYYISLSIRKWSLPSTRFAVACEVVNTNSLRSRSTTTTTTTTTTTRNA